jgi:ligand-binding sensor domain-containing protein
VLNKWIIYCLLLIPVSKAYSQKLVFENLGVKQGLPAMEVYNLHQDSRGYIWVFTEYGIVKHNGSKFVPVCKNLPLKESAVYGVTSSISGEMYIANSKARVYRISNDRAIPLKGFEEYTRRITKKSLPVLSLLIDNQSRLYLSCFEQTFVVPKSRYGRISKPIVAQKRPISAPKANQLFTIRKNDPVTGKLYISIADRFGKEKRKVVRDSIQISRSWSYEFNGNVYLSFMNEIRLFRKNGTTKVHRFKSHVINYKIAPNGHLWVALGGGLCELDEELNPLEHYLDNMIVSDVLIDNQSGMWVSTIGDGIYYSSDTDRLSFWNVNGLNGRINMLKNVGDKVFIGTDKGKLFVRRNGLLTEIHLKAINVVGVAGINDVIEFEGKYYVGGRHGIFILDKQFKLLELLRYSGYSFLKAPDGSLLFTTGSCIYQLKKDGRSAELVRKHSWNRIIIERDPGEFFINLADGLYRFKKTFSNPTAVKGLRNKNISRIKLDSGRNTWICTKGDGLYCLTTRNKLLHYTDLPSQIINDVDFLSDRSILLATNKGAFVKRLSQLSKQSSWKQLLNEEVLRVLHLGDEVMIGTSTGLTSVNTKKMSQIKNFRLYLSSVEIKNREIPFDRLDKLKHYQNDLYLSFDYLAFNEWSNELSYTLKGPSGLDGEVEGTKIHLQNLSPGYYVLNVYPSKHLGKNNLNAVTSFYIEPAFWQTTFFRGSMIVAGLVLASLCSWLIMRSRRKKEMQRIRIERLLAEYRLTALKAQVNPHFMSNSLVAIQELIIRKETSKANQYLAKFSALLRNLLNYSDQSVISLYNELKIIDLYIDLEQLRFSNCFVFKREIHEDIQLDQLFIPALITQPLIENAIWHGLLPLSEERLPTLILGIKSVTNGIDISITDNGVGRPDKMGRKEHTVVFKESKGMKLIEKRIENLNKLYAPAQGSIEFIDLKDESGKPVGSMVKLFFSLEMLNKLYHERNQERNY